MCAHRCTSRLVGRQRTAAAAAGTARQVHRSYCHRRRLAGRMRPRAAARTAAAHTAAGGSGGPHSAAAGGAAPRTVAAGGALRTASAGLRTAAARVLRTAAGSAHIAAAIGAAQAHSWARRGSSLCLACMQICCSLTDGQEQHVI